MVNTPLIISPQTENISDDTEITDGLDITANVLSAPGTDGGFIDEFDGAVVDASNFPTNVGGIIDADRLTFSIGGGSGYTQRYVGSKNYFDGAYKIKNAEIVVEIPITSVVDKIYQFGCASSLVTMNNGSHTRVTLRTFPGGSGTTSALSIYGPANYNLWTVTLAVGDILKVKFATFGQKVINGRIGNKVSYCINDSDWIETGVSGPFYDQLWLVSYFDSEAQRAYYGRVTVYGYPTSGIATLPEADAYTAQTPATLSSISTILVLLASAGAGGLLNYQIQRKSVEYPEWVDLDGVRDAWSDLGICDGTTPFDLSSIYKPLGTDQFRDQFVFSGSGLVAYPSVSGRTITWGSDVTAPSAPVITTAIATNESILTMLFANLLSDMYAVIFEANFNNSGSIPYSSRGIFETGYDYMRLRGNIGEVQQSGELNTLLMSIKGLAEGDVVTITAFARDDVGNVSAGTQKNITMSGAQYKMMFVEEIKSTLSSEVISGKLGCSDDN